MPHRRPTLTRVAIHVVQIGDLHLGRRALAALGEDGVNLREGDGYRAADALARLCEERRPDVVVCCGDLFDSLNPSTLARTHAFRLVGRLRAAGCAVIIIGGNHDGAQRRTPSPLMHLAEFFGATVALEQDEVCAHGVRLHLVPYGALARAAMGEPLAQFGLEAAGPHVLVAHGYVPSASLRPVPERVQLPLEVIRDPRWSAVMLGHIHRHVALEEGPAYYSGALEHLTFGEADATAGRVWWHEIAADGSCATTSLALADVDSAVPRPVRVVRLEDAGEVAETEAIVRDRLGALPAGAVCQLVVERAGRALRASGAAAVWPEWAREAGAAWCEVRLVGAEADPGGRVSTDAEDGRLDEQLRDFFVANDAADMAEEALAVYSEVTRQ